MESQSNPDIFEAARDRFIGSLSPEDRLLYSPCASAEDFREAVKKLEATATRVGRRGKSMRCVYTLSKRLEPYFEVVNIFIQSNPQYSALFWGAFRLVLQVGLIFCTLSDWTRSDVCCSCQVISSLSSRSSWSSSTSFSLSFPGTRMLRSYATMRTRSGSVRILRKST
jgi:hypothetical protein